MVNALLESASLLHPDCEEQLRSLLAQEKLLIFLGTMSAETAEHVRALLENSGRQAPVLVADKELRSRGSNHIRHATALHPAEFDSELVVRIQQDDFHPDMEALRQYRELADSHPDALLPLRAAEEYIDDARMVTVAPYLHDAQDLLSVIMRKKMGFATHLRHMRGLTRSLSLLHENGLAHRDVKPSNIFIDGDRVILGDPDLVVPFGPLHTGSVGTRMFMPPELSSDSVTDRTIGGWTDIYGAGVVLKCLNADFPGDAGDSPLKRWHSTPLQRSIRRIADACTATLPHLRPTVLELQNSLASVEDDLQDPDVAALEECSHAFLFFLRVAMERPDELDEAIVMGEKLKELLPVREQAFLLYHLGSLRALRARSASEDSDADSAVAGTEFRQSIRLDPYTAGVHAAFALDDSDEAEGRTDRPWLMMATLLDPGEHRPEPDRWIWQYLRDAFPEFSAACDDLRSEAAARWQTEDATFVAGETPAAFAALSADERLRCATLLHNCVRIAYMRNTAESLREALAMADAVRVLTQNKDLPASFHIMCADAWDQLAEFDREDADMVDDVRLRYAANRSAAWEEVLRHSATEPDVMEIYLRANAAALSDEDIRQCAERIAPVRRTPALLCLLASVTDDAALRMRILQNAYLLDPANPETNFALARDSLLAADFDIVTLTGCLRKVLLADAETGEIFLRMQKDVLIDKLSLCNATQMTAFMDMWLETHPTFTVCVSLTEVCNRLGFPELVRKLHSYQRNSDLQTLVSPSGEQSISGRTAFTARSLGQSGSLRQSSAGFGAHAVHVIREAMEKFHTATALEEGIDHCLKRTIPALLQRVASCIVLGDHASETPLIRRHGVLVAEPNTEILSHFAENPALMEHRMDTEDGHIVSVTSPIFAGENVVGFLHVERRFSMVHSGGEDSVAEVSEAVSGLLGGAASVRLLHKREAEVRAAEVTMAEVERMQRAILPGSTFTTERTDWGAVWQPGERNAGGDGYHWCRLPDGRLFSCLFDVEGHGAGAALYAHDVMMNVRRECTAFQNLPSLLHAVNNGMYRSLNPAEFSVHSGDESPVPDIKLATGVFLTFDQNSKILQAVSAGHGLPMILLDGVPYEYPDSEASKGLFPMNIMELDLQDCAENCVTVDLGATGASACEIALFSDGLNESFHKERPNEQLGMEGLRALIMRNQEPDLSKRAESILREMKRTHSTHDDCTLVLAHIDLKQ